MNIPAETPSDLEIANLYARVSADVKQYCAGMQGAHKALTVADVLAQIQKLIDEMKARGFVADKTDSSS